MDPWRSFSQESPATACRSEPRAGDDYQNLSVDARQYLNMYNVDAGARGQGWIDALRRLFVVVMALRFSSIASFSMLPSDDPCSVPWGARHRANERCVSQPAQDLRG